MVDRRRFMEACTGLGLGSTLFPGVLWAQTQAKGAAKITKEMIDAAATVADVAISDEYKEMMLDTLNEQAKGYEAIYALHIPNSVDPPFCLIRWCAGRNTRAIGNRSEYPRRQTLRRRRM